MDLNQIQQQIESFVRADWISTVLSAVVVLVVTSILAHIVTKFLRHILQTDKTNLPSSSIFVNIGRTAVWIVGGSIMLDACFNVNVSALIAALGVGGIAISLGFQDTISNLIGGLQVSLMRIVEPGDNIQVGSSVGVVKDVTWRQTTITNDKGEKVVIPNSIINKTALTQLPPPSKVKIPIVVVADGKHLAERVQVIEKAASSALHAVGEVAVEPALSFSEITADGFKGLLVFKMEDASVAGAAADAAVRSIAPLTRGELNA